MRKVIPLEKQVESEKSIRLLEEACQNVNSHLADLDETDYQDITELCFYLLTGHKRKDINSSVFEIIYLYIKENMGKMDIEFSKDNTISKIEIGKIKMGSLCFKDFSEEEKEERLEKRLNCCGIYPTMDRKERMFLTLEDKLIMGNQAIIKQTDYNNVFIGPYYFNRDTIFPNKASLTKLELISDRSIEEDIYEFDESGEKESYQGIISLEESKDGEYFIKSSIDRKELFANKYGIRPSNTSSLRVK